MACCLLSVAEYFDLYRDAFLFTCGLSGPPGTACRVRTRKPQLILVTKGLLRCTMSYPKVHRALHPVAPAPAIPLNDTAPVPS